MKPLKIVLILSAVAAAYALITRKGDMHMTKISDLLLLKKTAPKPILDKAGAPIVDHGQVG